MPRTKTEIVESIKDAIVAASPQIRVDADKGPFYHLSAVGVAGSLADASAQTERLAQLSTLQFPNVATEAEALAMARSFGLSLSVSGFASGIAYAYTSRRPVGSEVITVSEGTAFSTSSTRGGISFEATETRSLTAGNADAYYNPATRRYELPVRVRAISAGTLGNIAARTIVSVQSPDFDGAVNLTAFRGGTEAQTVETLYRRVQQRLGGLDNFSRGGLLSRVLNFDVERVQSAALTYSTEYPVLFYRLPDKQAIDVWVLGTPMEEVITESFVASAGQTSFVLNNGPVMYLSSVQVNGSSVVASLDLDESPTVGRSTREASQVTLSVAASAGDVVDITYGYDGLLVGIQDELDGYLNDESGALFATDVLVRYPKTTPMVVSVTGTVLGSFDRSTVEQEVAVVVGDYLANRFGSESLLGGVRTPAELRDAIKASVPGVGMLNIPEFCRKSIGGIVEVVTIPRNSQAVLESSADLIVSFN